MMAMTPEQQKLCRDALNSMKTIPLLGPFPYGADDLRDVLARNGMLEGTINLQQQTATGFSAAGVNVIIDLAKTFRPNLSETSRRVSNATLAKFIAGEIMSQWTGRTSSSLAQTDFDQLESALNDWFASQTHVREHVVPCTLFPCVVPSFPVGPVTFRHCSELPTDGFGISRKDFWPKEAPAWRRWLRSVWAAIRAKAVALPEAGGFQFSVLLRFAEERKATWMAFVEVPGRPQAESIRAADVSTDIALAAIQLISPGDDLRTIARASARAAPTWRVDISRDKGGGFSQGIHNRFPGLTRSPDSIECHIKGVKPVLDSMGRRLAAYINATSALPDLDAAWCNAAYWYHEALAESLDTVAVAKLETAIEVLFRAENMSGSKRRILDAFEAFFGLKPLDLIDPTSTVTVQQFVAAITTARSRVLHGTWPTLHHDLPAEKSSLTVTYGDVELITRLMLISFSTQLDSYESTGISGSSADTTDAFLGWIKAQTAADAGTL